jgi:hypothetical protein
MLAEDVTQFVKDDVLLVERCRVLLVENDIDGFHGRPRTGDYAVKRDRLQHDGSTATFTNRSSKYLYIKGIWD